MTVLTSLRGAERSRFVAVLSDSYVEDLATGCWNWTGSVNSRGYPILCFGQRKASVARMFYLAFCGDVRADQVVGHLCSNVGCVRPSHLRLYFQAENARRWHAFKRARALKNVGEVS